MPVPDLIISSVAPCVKPKFFPKLDKNPCSAVAPVNVFISANVSTVGAGTVTAGCAGTVTGAPPPITDCDALVVSSTAGNSVAVPGINPFNKPPVIAPVNPAVIPSLRLPPSAIVPSPVPNADAPTVPSVAPNAVPPNSVGAINDPMSGRNASGCPVCGLMVNLPVGDNFAKASTSIGFMCTIMVSPYLPCLASCSAAFCNGKLLIVVS